MVAHKNVDHLFPDHSKYDLKIEMAPLVNSIHYRCSKNRVGIHGYHVFLNGRYELDTQNFLEHVGMEDEDIVLWLLRFGSTLPSYFNEI